MWYEEYVNYLVIIILLDTDTDTDTHRHTHPLYLTSKGCTLNVCTIRLTCSNAQLGVCVCFEDRISLCSPGCPGTSYVEASLKLVVFLPFLFSGTGLLHTLPCPADSILYLNFVSYTLLRVDIREERLSFYYFCP